MGFMGNVIGALHDPEIQKRLGVMPRSQYKKPEEPPQQEQPPMRYFNTEAPQHEKNHSQNHQIFRDFSLTYEPKDEDDREEERHEKKRKKPMELHLAHFNPKELEVLDDQQGGRTTVPGTKTPHYKKIEIMLSTPGGEEAFRKVFEKHASGGQIGESKRHIDELKRKGRFGDSEMAYIGGNTRRIFDKTVKDLSGDHRENKNPHTGHPEYFGLGSIFSGIKNGIGSAGKFLGNMGNQAMHAIGTAAPGMIQGGLTGLMEGGPEGALLGAGMGGLGSMMGGGGQPQGNYQPGQAQNQMNQMNQQGQQGIGQANQYGQNAMSNMNRMGQDMISNLANRASQGLHQGTQYGQNQMNQGTQYGQNAMNQANQYGQNQANQYDQNQMQNNQRQMQMLQQRQQQFGAQGQGGGYGGGNSQYQNQYQPQQYQGGGNYR
jgi:hypothetical protein